MLAVSKIYIQCNVCVERERERESIFATDANTTLQGDCKIHIVDCKCDYAARWRSSSMINTTSDKWRCERKETKRNERKQLSNDLFACCCGKLTQSTVTSKYKPFINSIIQVTLALFVKKILHLRHCHWFLVTRCLMQFPAYTNHHKQSAHRPSNSFILATCWVTR